MTDGIPLCNDLSKGQRLNDGIGDRIWFRALVLISCVCRFLQPMNAPPSTGFPSFDSFGSFGSTAPAMIGVKRSVKRLSAPVFLQNLRLPESISIHNRAACSYQRCYRVTRVRRNTREEKYERKLLTLPSPHFIPTCLTKYRWPR